MTKTVSDVGTPSIPASKAIDPETQRLINQAYALSVANGQEANKATGPAPSSTGQLTYNNQSIDSLLNGIYSQKTPNFLGDASKQAATIYAPVLNDLTSQANAAIKRAAGNTKTLQSTYGALANSIGSDATGIKDNTKNTVNSENAAANTTVSNIANNFNNANSSVANLMQRLGIQASAGSVLPQGAEHQAFLQGIVQNAGNAQSALTKQLGANALNYNTAQKNIAGFEGAQNIKTNQGNLGNTLAQLASTRANVGTEQAGKASDLASALQSQYTASLNAQSNALVQQYATQQQMAAAQLAANTQLQVAGINANAKQAAAAAKASTAGQPTAYQQYEMTDPGTKIYADAAQTFGSNTDAASRAVALANGVAAKQYPNAQSYAEAVVSANNSQSPAKRLPPDKLRSLAYTMFTTLNNNPTPLNFIPNS